MKSPCGHQQAECVIGNFWKCPVCDADNVKIEASTVTIGVPDFDNPHCEAFVTEEALQELEEWFDSHIHTSGMSVDFYGDDQGNLWTSLPESSDLSWTPEENEWATTWSWSGCLDEGVQELPVWARLDDMAADPDLIPALHTVYVTAGFEYGVVPLEHFTKIRKENDDYMVFAKVNGEDMKFPVSNAEAFLHGHMCSECDRIAGQAVKVAPVFRTLDCDED